FVSAVSREVIAAVPRAQREAALALGATRWESTWQIVLPAARAGLIGAVMLGLGRAIGETMAVTMVIGNTPAVPKSLFAPAYTMASVLANEFAEASGDVHRSALMYVALLLLGVTLVVNAAARALVWRVERRAAR
ncbi:MAG TPA: ABC transporter permease subunit, partial [Longimicrobiaceae bacterium]|nr:ABC transporter permease subunit [Longimicrobiaceae bacterium]